MNYLSENKQECVKRMVEAFETLIPDLRPDKNKTEHNFTNALTVMDNWLKSAQSGVKWFGNNLSTLDKCIKDVFVYEETPIVGFSPEGILEHLSQDLNKDLGFVETKTVFYSEGFTIVEFDSLYPLTIALYHTNYADYSSKSLWMLVQYRWAILEALKGKDKAYRRAKMMINMIFGCATLFIGCYDAEKIIKFSKDAIISTLCSIGDHSVALVDTDTAILNRPMEAVKKSIAEKNNTCLLLGDGKHQLSNDPVMLNKLTKKHRDFLIMP